MRRDLGNDLNLGTMVGKNAPLTFTKEARATHLYCCGATGSGKSKFLENLIRQDIIAWRKSKCGLLLLDPHGSLYDSLMRWLAFNNIDRPIVPIDLRNDEWVVAYNLLRSRAVADPAVIVSRFVQAMAYVWGQAGTNETPLFARWASNIVGTLYEKKLSLVEAEHLIDRMGKQVRQNLTQNLSNRSMANDWAYANSLSPKEFEAQISSTINRLHSFLATKTMRNMFGQINASLDLAKAMQEGHIVLVSLATERSKVSNEDASLFATLLLSDLWETAREMGKSTGHDKRKPFYVYLDEFQRFVTPTIADNLDEARGFGLHLTLAHQFPNQLLHTGPHGKQVLDSIMVNARSKVVFGMEGEENLRPLAQSLFMGTMSPDKIKHELYSTKVMGYREEYRKSYARSKGTSRGRGAQSGSAAGAGLGGTEMFPFEQTDPSFISTSESQFASHSRSESESWGDSEAEGETESPMQIPIMGKELSSVQFESLEEQLFRSMAVLFDQEQRQCVARIVGNKIPVSLFTPTVKEVPHVKQKIATYTSRHLQGWPFAISATEAEKLVNERTSMLSPKPSHLEIEEPTTAKRRVR